MRDPGSNPELGNITTISQGSFPIREDDLQPATPQHSPDGASAVDPSPGTASSQLPQSDIDVGEGVARPPSDQVPRISINAAASIKTLDRCTDFWLKYNGIADTEDKEFVRAAGGDLDVLLIFAGLFSAVNTSFIIEAYKSLKADPVDETNTLLRSVVISLQNASYAGGVQLTQPFASTSHDITVNTFFFLSLCCSLSAAFGAVLAKQWLAQYGRDGGSLEPPTTRGRGRQRRYNGRDKWHLEDVIATLPTLLQLSLFFFLIGLVMFLWPLNIQIALIIITFAVVTFSFYITTISISILDPSSPFQTRFSIRLRLLWSRWKGLLAVMVAWIWLATVVVLGSGVLMTKTDRALGCICITTAFLVVYLDSEVAHEMLRWGRCLISLGPVAHVLQVISSGTRYVLGILLSVYNRILQPISARCKNPFWAVFKKATIQGQEIILDDPAHDARCAAYVLERTTTSEDLYMVADALKFISDNSGAITVAEALITFHLRPMYRSGCWVLQGFSNSVRKPLLNLLHVLIVDWEYYNSRSAQTQLLLPEDAYRGPSTSRLAFRLPQAICSWLWNAFLADPQDGEAFDIILKISTIRPPRERPAKLGPIRIEWDAMGKALCSDSDEAVQRRCLMLLNATNDLVCPSQTLSLSFRRSWCTPNEPQGILHLTMWADISARKPNLDGIWTAMLRIQALPVLLPPEELLASHFAEYLALCFTRYALPEYEQMVRGQACLHRREIDRWEQWSLCWSYILAVRHLLARGDPRLWSEELRKHGHLSILRAVLSDFPTELHYPCAPFALYCFLNLWVHDVDEGDLTGASSPYTSGEFVQTVVAVITTQELNIQATTRSIEITSNIYADESTDNEWSSQVWEDISKLMQWMLLYLQTTIQGGLVAEQEVGGVVQGYKRWCKAVDECDMSPGGNACATLSEQLDSVGRTFMNMTDG